MRPTAFSLPGMVRAEKITVSPRDSVTSGCWSSAMRAKRRARLALAAGAQRHDLVGRQIAVGIHRPERLDAFEIAKFARNRDDALHRAPDHDHFAVVFLRCQRHRPQARHVRCEGCHRDAAFRRLDQRRNIAGDFAFRRRDAVAHGIGGIADNGETARIAERAQLCFVGAGADQRRAVDLPVAGMQHRAQAACE